MPGYKFPSFPRSSVGMHTRLPLCVPTQERGNEVSPKGAKRMPGYKFPSFPRSGVGMHTRLPLCVPTQERGNEVSLKGAKRIPGYKSFIIRGTPVRKS